MKIEMDNNSCLVAWISIIALTVLAFCWICMSQYTRRVEAAFAAGYVESTVPGTNALVWTKK